MRYLSRIKQQRSAGFTLVEILIIAPIVVLAIGGFIALMVTTVGEVLATRDQSTITFDTQSALDRIEQDVRLSTQFLQTTNTLTAPQGSDSNFTGTAAFTNGTNSLLLSELATDQNPTSTSRWLVYYANQPNPCGTNQKYNRPLLTKVIYFINNGSLWRRQVLPTYNTNPPATADNNTLCSAPWQKNTCSPGYSAVRCETNDEEIMKNIDSLTVQYYSDPGSSTDLGASGALTAATINASITAKKTTAGKNLVNTGSVRVTKLNSIDTTQLPPSAPVVSHTSVTPENIEFAWPAVPSATSYQVGYMINSSGNWVSQTLDAGTLKFVVNANRNDVISFRVSAFNSAGVSGYGTDSATIPAWSTCTLQNGWVNYGNGYASPGFTKTKDDIIVLKGLVKSGSTGGWTTICTLPVGYRPSGEIIFQIASNNSFGRVDVQPTGEVQFVNGSNSWFDFDGVTFVASDSPYSWTALTPINGWTNFNSGYAPLQSTIDNTGRVHVQGLVTGGTNTNGTAVATLPSNMTPAAYAHFPEYSNSGFNYLGVSTTNLQAKGITTSWYSQMATYYPSSYSGWTNLSLQNSWVTYGASWSSPQYTKSADGIVTVKGLIKSGVTTNGTTIATLPAGYRPLERQIMHNIAYGAYGRVDILPSGVIQAVNVDANWTSLDNINFIAEQ